MTEAVGVDFGGTKIAAGVVDDSGQVLRRARTASDPDKLCDQIVELVGELDASAVGGVGIGAAGIVDHAAGRYLYGPNTGLEDLDLVRELSERLGCAVALDNDANCAAWGEHRFGVGRGTQHFVCVTLGTGIGGGFVLQGRPYRGAHGGAAEIGHMLVDPEGPPCGCGRRGCWEQYASGMALERLAAKELPTQPQSALRSEEKVTGERVSAAARAGDAFARDLVERTARWVGWGLASLVNILEPERVAVAGGLADDWDLFEATAKAAMHERVEASDARPMPPVVRAELGADAGIVGAALLVLDEAYG